MATSTFTQLPNSVKLISGHLSATRLTHLETGGCWSVRLCPVELFVFLSPCLSVPCLSVPVSFCPNAYRSLCCDFFLSVGLSVVSLLQFALTQSISVSYFPSFS